MASKGWFLVIKAVGDAAHPGAVKWLAWDGTAWVDAHGGKFYATRQEVDAVMVGLTLSEPDSYIGLMNTET